MRAASHGVDFVDVVDEVDLVDTFICRTNQDGIPRFLGIRGLYRMKCRGSFFLHCAPLFCVVYSARSSWVT